MKKKMSMYPVVILAGGLATRLWPLSKKTPKSMIDINGEPFIAHQLRLLRKNNIRKVVLCIGYLGEKILEFVGTGEKFDLDITTLMDGHQLLGTGGALKGALGHLLQDTFFVLYGDSYLPCHFAEVQKAFKQSPASALMTVFRNNGLWDKSNIEFSQGKIIAYDKKQQTPNMQHIDYGLGIMTRRVLEQIPGGNVCDLATLYQNLLKEGQLDAFEVHQRFYEVGSFAGIKELRDYLQELTR